MGITISHDAWQSSYYAFWLWRKHLFAVAGFGDLRTLDEYFDPDDDDWPEGVPEDVVVRGLKDERLPKQVRYHCATPRRIRAAEPHITPDFRVQSLACTAYGCLVRVVGGLSLRRKPT